MDLFDLARNENIKTSAPLAERMKPRYLHEFIGQGHIIGEGKLLSRMIEADKLTSIIFCGPPGTGKTSLARVIANTTSSEFISINAVTSGIKDIKEAVETAKNALGMYSKKTILFIDEIHRFNKLQQDALLPFVENGTVILIGATTENPYYEVNSALISRSTVFRLQPLLEEDICNILNATLKDPERGYGFMNVSLSEEATKFLVLKSNGDARKALNALELAVLTTKKIDDSIQIDLKIAQDCLVDGGFLYDKSGDSHYDVASAFIKSMRGSDPDAAVHYLARMIVGGEDPIFIARRIVIAASEDVGNADPNALLVAVAALKAVETIGYPEARITLSQAAIYVALAPKSNACYTAIDDAILDIENGKIGKIPYYLKDGTSLKMQKKNESLSIESYKYPHDYEGGYVEQQYLPDDLVGKKYYKPKF